MQKNESNSRVMRFSSNENRNEYYRKKYGFVPGFVTRNNPKKAASKAAIKAAQYSRRQIISNHHQSRRAKLPEKSRSSIRTKRDAEETPRRAAEEAARRAEEEADRRAAEAARRDAISRNPSATIFNLLRIGQLNKPRHGGYTRRKHRNYRK